MIALIQPFGLLSPGGGSRILRALLATDHPQVLSINTGLMPCPSTAVAPEIHLPLRPSFGRLDRTRIHGALGVFDEILRRRFEERLKSTLKEHQVRVIHSIPHSYDIVPVTRVAYDLGIPYLLNVHDDLLYTAIGHPCMAKMVSALGEAWQTAKRIFVISEEIGLEYSRRFGEREFQIITDGLIRVPEAPLKSSERKLRIYFMGLFHNTYSPNLRSLLDALQILRGRHPSWEISMTCRSGSISCATTSADVPVKVLPFASEEQVARDILCADLLYQPLPFQAEAASFGKFSMSTKLVTYLGSGLPILYHGPNNAAAYRLLATHDAAVICTSLDSESIAQQLLKAEPRRQVIVNNALGLARSRFSLADQQSRFWRDIEAVQASGPAPRQGEGAG